MNKLLVLFISIVTLSFFQCSTMSSESSALLVNTKSLSLSLALPCSETGNQAEISTATMILSASDMDTITQKMSIENCRVSGTFNSIPVGENRHIEIRIYNKNNALVYFGETSADILDNAKTTVTIRLKQVSGSLEVIGILCDNSNAFVSDEVTLALYHFDESSGTKLIDASENGWDGTNYGGQRVKGISGNALHFDSASYAKFDTIIPNGMETGTVEFSVKLDADFDTSCKMLFFGNDGSRCNLIYNAGELVFFKNHSDDFRYATAKVNLPTSQWIHFAITWGSKGMRIFINDSLLVTKIDQSCYETSPRTTEENVFTIGLKSSCCMNGYNGLLEPLHFKGSIDEVRISSVDRYDQ